MKNGLALPRAVALCALLLCIALPAVAAEHRLETLDEQAPADELAPEIAKLLAPTGVRVIRGSSRTVADLWLLKEWPVRSFEAQGDVNYPFTPGQLIGVIRYPRKGSDFRDQEIPEGVYTLRYGQQPVDGAHVGTSPTRDFLMLQPAAEDKSPEALAYKPNVELSAQTTGTPHPAILSLQRTENESGPIRNQEERDWWIVRLEGTATMDGKSQKLPADLVIVGQAE